MPRHGGGCAPSHHTEGERDLASLGFGGSSNNRNVPKGQGWQASRVSLESNKWRHLGLINCVSEQTLEKTQISQPKQRVYHWLAGGGFCQESSLGSERKEARPFQRVTQSSLAGSCAGPPSPPRWTGAGGAAPSRPGTILCAGTLERRGPRVRHSCRGGQLGSWSLMCIYMDEKLMYFPTWDGSCDFFSLLASRDPMRATAQGHWRSSCSLTNVPAHRLGQTFERGQSQPE